MSTDQNIPPSPSQPKNDGAGATAQDGAPAFNGRQRKRRKTTCLAALAIFLGLAGVFGYPAYVEMITHETTDDAFVESQVVAISPKVAGHVARVLVADNQQVRKGDLLAEVDPRDLEVELDIALARMRSAMAAKAEAEALVSVAQNNMAQQGASLSSSRAELAQAKAGVAEFEAGNMRDASDLERMAQIAKAGAVSRQEYDHAKAQAAMSQAKLNSAQKEVETQNAKIIQAKAMERAARDKLRQAQAMVDIRAAELREAEAAVEQARLNLSYARITAPSSGFVTKKAVEPGAYVQKGQKILSIVSQEVWVVANFKETQIARIRPGQPVTITVDAYPDALFKGRVDSIQRGTGSRFTLLPPENASGNFIKVVQRVPVKIVLEAEAMPEGFVLAPGLSVAPSVDITAEGLPGALSASTAYEPKTAMQ